MSVMVVHEMAKLREELDKRGIQWTDDSEEFVASDDKGLSLWICRTHFTVNGCNWSVINGIGSYGGVHRDYHTGVYENAGLLEAYMMEGDNEPVGFLTADKCISLIFDGVEDT